MRFSLALSHVPGPHVLGRAVLVAALSLMPVLTFAQAPAQARKPGGRPIMPHEQVEALLRTRMAQPPSPPLVRGVAQQMPALQASGGAGTLDPSFGTAGKQTVDFGGSDDVGQAVAVDASGRIVMAGISGSDFAVTRLLGDGTLDPAFGNGGLQTIDLGAPSEGVRALVMDANGRIILAGSTSTNGVGDFAIARLLSDGTLDPAFGNGGKKTVDFDGSSASGYAVEVDASGRVIVAGTTYSNRAAFAVVRLLSDGTLDPTFGTGGKQTIDVGGTSDQAYAMALDESGRIVMAGYSQNKTTLDLDFGVVRLLNDGSLDVSFGIGGKQTVDFAGYWDVGLGVAIDAGGRILVVGFSDTYTSEGGSTHVEDFAIARLLSDGSLDASFGNGGKQTFDSGNASGDMGFGVTADSIGRTVVVGRLGNSSLAMRLLGDGTLDPGFGTGGKQPLNVGLGMGRRVTLDASARIVVAGDSDSGSDHDFSVVRLLGGPDSEAPSSTTLSGTVTDASGAPVRGVHVRAFGPAGRAAVSDGDGRFTIGGLSQGATYTLRTSPGVLAHTVTLSSDPSDVTLRLPFASANRRLYGWGYNVNGQLGFTSDTQTVAPTLIPDVPGFLKVTSRPEHTLALDSDGRVWAWGANYSGELGEPPSYDSRPTPTLVEGLADVVDIASEYGLSVALTADGRVWTWGQNDNGQLGDGTTTPRSTPTPVDGLDDIVAVTVGEDFVAALAADGTVWAWGNNDYRELGDGSATDRHRPVQVNAIDNAVALGSGVSYTVALLSDGTARAWGWNGYGDYGFLGDGATGDRFGPVTVQGLTDAVDLSVQYTLSLALRTDGTVWAWGGNDVGQIGDGTTTSRTAPVQVQGLSGVVGVDAGHNLALAVTAEGRVWAWGMNDDGELGDGTTLDRKVPGLVEGVSSAFAVGASEHHAFALVEGDASEGTSPFTVTNTNDTGPGSLRQVIADANVAPGADTVRFAIPGTGVHTIRPVTPLVVTDSLVLDASTQPGFAGTPVVELDGSLLSGWDWWTLDVRGAGSTVRGFVFSHSNVGAIALKGQGGHRIVGNYIGTDATGLVAARARAAAATYGVNISAPANTIGGPTAADRNVIAAATYGITVDGDRNVIAGNYIGVGADGATAIGNHTGVALYAHENTVGGPTAAHGNVISGNGSIGIQSVRGGTARPAEQVTAPANNVVTHNRIGTDATGITAVPNGTGLHVIGTVGMRIGGAGGEGNLISGNRFLGIYAVWESGAVGACTILGNRIGTTADGAPLGNGSHGIQLTRSGSAGSAVGTGCVVGDASVAAAANTVAHNGGRGVSYADGTQVRGNAVFANGGPGLYPEQALDDAYVPRLDTVVATPATVTVRGRVLRGAGRPVTVDVYSTPPPYASSTAGVGRVHLGSVAVEAGAEGEVAFTFVSAQAVEAGHLVTATATGAPSDGVLPTTSAFSAGRIVPVAAPAPGVAVPVLAALPTVVSIEPTLDWNDTPRIAAYTVEIATDTAFATKRTVGTGTTSRLPVRFDALSLVNATTYHWRVTATDSSGASATSARGTFTTTPAAIANLRYPSTGTTGLYPLGIALTWDVTVAGTYTYRVHLDEGAAATPADWSAMTVDQAATTSPLRVDLSGGAAYQWRVATHNATLAATNALAGTTVSYSAPASFATSGSPGGGAAAQVVVATYPVSSSAPLYTPTATLSYYAQGGALSGTTFDVRYREAAGTYGATPQTTGLSALTFTTVPLTGGASYAWQARACVGATCGPWSTEQTFSLHASATPTAGAAIPTPTQLSPATGVTVYGASTRLSWAAPASGLTYRAYTRVCGGSDCAAEIATTSGYSETQLGTARRLDLPVTGGTSVAWYVRACAASGDACSVPSAVMYFTVGATSTPTSTPTAAVASWPTSGGTVYTLTPVLQWHLSGTATGVTGYEVRVGTSNDPGTFLISATTSGAESRAFTVPAGILAWGQPYVWHVRTAGTGSWASASFQTTAASGASLVVLDWPSKGETAQSTTPLGWHLTGSAAGVSGYEVELTRTGSPAVTTVTAVSAPASALSVSGLTPGATYAWRVRSLGAYGTSDWTAPGTFVVAAGAASVVPVAESPAAGVVLTGGAAPMLSWSLPVVSESVLTYDIEIARTRDMASARVVSGIAEPYVSLASLAGGDYYWRVRSRSSGGDVSTYSAVERFASATATSAEVDAVVPTEYGFAPLFPNPSQERTPTRVRVLLPEASPLSIEVYDMLGRRVLRHVEASRAAGIHDVEIGTETLPPGTYVVRVSAGAFHATRTLVVPR